MQINEVELYKSCQVLFGGQLDVSREFLEYIQWSGVKSAYRKKVRETHPDIAAREGELVQRRKADEFRSVQEAYENITNFLSARDKGYHLISSHTLRPGGVRTAPTSGSADLKTQGSAKHRRKEGEHPFGGFSTRSPKKDKGAVDSGFNRPVTSSLYKGALPRRKLLFGHFLYYSGLINWRTIVKALTWQRNNRPRIGELGKRVGWLTAEDVERVIRSRKGMESFGQSAIEMRLLNIKQLQSLIVQQKRLQRRFGDFFIAHKIFSHDQMESLALKCHRHNGRFDR